MSTFLFDVNQPIAKELAETIVQCDNWFDCLNACKELVELAHVTAETESFGGNDFEDEIILSANFFGVEVI